jgi:hypothetical protein
MKHASKPRGSRRPQLLALGLLAILATAGCQVDVGGQTLPSPYYLSDDIQYYAPGPEFKLANEAAAQKAFRAQEALGEAAGGETH